MSVAISKVESNQNYEFWRWLSECADLPNLETEGRSKDLHPLVKEAARVARAKIWAADDDSLRDRDDDTEKQTQARKRLRAEKIEAEVGTVVEWLAKSERAAWLLEWTCTIDLILRRDRLLETLPTKDGFHEATARLDGWWDNYWPGADKTDLDATLGLTESLAEWQVANSQNKSDAELAVVVFLARLRNIFPDAPLTSGELLAIQQKRRARAVAERFATGFDDELRSHFFREVDRMIDGFLTVPCSGDAKAEADLAAAVFTGNKLDTCKLAAALLQTAHVINAENPRVQGIRIHPIHGYGMATTEEWSDAPGKLRAVAPGYWRLAIEGEQYLLTCELWPRPVVMSPHEFGRARGSANAILRDVGIAVDSPPGHWKAVWETHGLRSQLLASAERIDPRVRIEEFKAWIRRIASAAPAANRPPANGAAVRLADGATVASHRWLIGQAMADGIIRAHEEALFEKTLRQSARKTNRRDANRVQQRLLTIDATGEPVDIPLISKGTSPLIENYEEA